MYIKYNIRMKNAFRPAEAIHTSITVCFARNCPHGQAAAAVDQEQCARILLIFIYVYDMYVRGGG